MTLLQSVLVFIGGWVFLFGGIYCESLFNNRFLKGASIVVLILGIVGIIVGGFRIEHTFFID